MTSFIGIQGLEQRLSGPGSCQVKVQLLFRGGGGLLLVGSHDMGIPVWPKTTNLY